MIIFGRGGGSAEDLSAFNSEVVARAVYSSRIPTISAVGHETDFSIADLVADMRAPTPSAAAELAVPEMSAILAAIDGSMEQISTGVLRRIAESSRMLESQMALITALSPRSRLDNAEQRLDELSARIRTGMHNRLDRAERALDRKCGGYLRTGSAGSAGKGLFPDEHGKWCCDLLRAAEAGGRYHGKIVRRLGQGFRH